ncbi:hypothetical protein IGI37_003126 [Enterococcus sp. AZ194]|uniref:phage holin family protein n=1 Tax=Enterococcus sp. AZ194 TaxID=2774629 RepID=UPI003F254EFA
MTENMIKLSAATLGGVFGVVFGEWSTVMQVVIGIIIVDYLTGILSATTNGALSSRVGFKGIARKMAILLVIAVAHLLDTLLGDKSMLRDAVAFFYIANELISILENVAKMNVGVPANLQGMIKKLLSMSGETDSYNGDHEFTDSTAVPTEDSKKGKKV